MQVIMDYAVKEGVYFVWSHSFLVLRDAVIAKT